jgi:YYY domain-containing protein
VLAVTVGVSCLFAPGRLLVARDPAAVARILCIAVTAGVLFTVNSWDYPIYLVVVAAGIAANAYLLDERRIWWQDPLLTVAAVALASLVLFAPFYAHYRSVAGGIGLVTTPSDVWEFMQVLGFFVLCAFLLVGALGVLLQPADEETAEEDLPASGAAASEVGQVQAWAASNVWSIVLLAGIVLLGLRFHLLVLVLLLGIGGGALVLLYRVSNTDEPNRADAVALLLVAAGCLAAAVPEVVYLRDVFDGSPSYRMNTVFKFDYQAWVLLGLAAAYAVFRAWQALKTQFSLQLGWAVLVLAAVGTLLGAVYTWDAPHSSAQGGTATSLDALASLRVDNPGDYGMVTWLKQHASPDAVEMEAVGQGSQGDEYRPEFARIATLSGLRAVMGWEGHEVQWRGPDPEIQTRTTDVRTLYSTTSDTTARTILRRYGVRYVIVGQTERSVFGARPAALSKFAHFMRVAYRVRYTVAGATREDTIYTW